MENLDIQQNKTQEQINQEFRAKWRMIRKKCNTLSLWSDADCDYYEYDLNFDSKNRAEMPFFKELYLEFEDLKDFIDDNQIEINHIKSVLGYVNIFIEKMTTESFKAIQKRTHYASTNKAFVLIHLNTIKETLEDNLKINGNKEPETETKEEETNINEIVDEYYKIEKGIIVWRKSQNTLAYLLSFDKHNYNKKIDGYRHYCKLIKKNNTEIKEGSLKTSIIQNSCNRDEASELDKIKNTFLKDLDKVREQRPLK